MRKKLRRLGRLILGLLARSVIKKHKPNIIGIIGDGETAICREVLYTLFNRFGPTRRNLESPSVEFSLLLTVIGAPDYPQSIVNWIKLITKTALQIIILKSYQHTLILEMSPANQETLNYWFDVIKPNLIVICGTPPENLPEGTYDRFKIRQDNLSVIKEDVLKIGGYVGLDTKEAKYAIEGVDFYPTRIRFFQGSNGRLIIDATHYYYPVPLESVLELIEKLPGKKLIISKELMGNLPKDFQITTSHDPTLVDESSVIIVRGRRADQFELLEDLTSGHYE